jgi:hypothetical protein
MNEPEQPTHIDLVKPRYVDNLADCFFYHTMTLPVLGEVRGHWDLRGRFSEYVGGVDLGGKSVLDVGAATGFLSFEAEKSGASRVLSFDIGNARQQNFLPFKISCTTATLNAGLNNTKPRSSSGKIPTGYVIDCSNRRLKCFTEMSTNCRVS